MDYKTKLFIIAFISGVVFSTSPITFAQTNGPQPTKKDKAPQTSEDKPQKKDTSKTDTSDTLGDLFKKAEDEIKNGQHCGPAPEPEGDVTPIA